MTSDHPTPADGTHTVRGVPRGFTSLTPFVALRDPLAAIDFYCRVFDAELVNASVMGDQVLDALIQFDNGRLQLGSAVPGYHLRALDPAADESQFTLRAYVADVDAVVTRALAAGATLREPVAVFVSGDRYASLQDPFGVRWSVMTRVVDLSDEESSRRVRSLLDRAARRLT